MLTLVSSKTTAKSLALDLHGIIDELLGDQLNNGDILVVSSMFIAISEGRVVSLDSVRAGNRAIELSAVPVPGVMEVS
jgi:F420-0:gamma-glutamyl ligase